MHPRPPQAFLYTVRGRVQGVWFRDSTRREAERLNISGYAMNRDDGSVEVLAIGTAEALREMTTWLRSGPPMADVSDLSWEQVEAQTAAGFDVR
ncbi:MAG: acylphosphatase [Gammaproteobacteria bacterium]|nr:acylphosphatase [Gammaproteobacteria bacterium]